MRLFQSGCRAGNPRRASPAFRALGEQVSPRRYRLRNRQQGVYRSLTLHRACRRICQQNSFTHRRRTRRSKRLFSGYRLHQHFSDPFLLAAGRQLKLLAWTFFPLIGQRANLPRLLVWCVLCGKVGRSKAVTENSESYLDCLWVFLFCPVFSGTPRVRQNAFNWKTACASSGVHPLRPDIPGFLQHDACHCACFHCPGEHCLV